jgi:hypothetical protein
MTSWPPPAPFVPPPAPTDVRLQQTHPRPQMGIFRDFLFRGETRGMDAMVGSCDTVASMFGAGLGGEEDQEISAR